MLPWLITTTAWPGLTADVAAATARVVVGPAMLGGAAALALVFAAALVRHGRPRQHPGDRIT